ncbi:rolling circle replication-associated protein [Burkholderia ubonensis]|uniref:rolling circle replication-associated protein n=1 Tax=Burkholderia ubonensis TaxID=101571 RepID=UPI00210A8577|nr:hypothetical protein [Burkholderia ubonensis]
MSALSLNAKPKAKRGESENSESNLMDAAKRAKQQVRLRCKAIGADRMITLTCRENMTDKARLKRDFDKLLRRLGGLYDFQYVAVAERQKRGAWHLRVAVRGRQNYRVLRSIWQSIVGVGNGQINVRNPFKEKGGAAQARGLPGEVHHEGFRGARAKRRFQKGPVDLLTFAASCSPRAS